MAVYTASCYRNMEEAFETHHVEASPPGTMGLCWLPSHNDRYSVGQNIHPQPISQTSMDNENQSQALWGSITNSKTPCWVFFLQAPAWCVLRFKFRAPRRRGCDERGVKRRLAACSVTASSSSFRLAVYMCTSRSVREIKNDGGADFHGHSLSLHSLLRFLSTQ